MCEKLVITDFYLVVDDNNMAKEFQTLLFQNPNSLNPHNIIEGFKVLMI